MTKKQRQPEFGPAGADFQYVLSVYGLVEEGDDLRPCTSVVWTKACGRGAAGHTGLGSPQDRVFVIGVLIDVLEGICR